MSESRIAKLVPLAEMLSQNTLSELSVINRRVAAIESEIEKLRRVPGGFGSGFRCSGAEAKWQIWREDRIRKLNLELAKLRAEAENARAKASRAVGRQQVLERLAQDSTSR